MKFEMTSSYHTEQKSPVINPFDAGKFLKRIQYKEVQAKEIQGKEKKNWWNRFMQGVESKRSEIYRDLNVYRRGI